MADKFLELFLSAPALAAQTQQYGRRYAVRRGGPADVLGEAESEFIRSRDSFYVATVTPEGWPYVQHRGGPPGFLRVLDARRIGFADLSGNRQLISTGNLAENDRVALLLMDYPSRTRLKIAGHARVLSAAEDPALTEALTPSAQARKKVERLFVVEVVGFDWNCPQHITPRYTLAEVEAASAPLLARIAELEARLAAATTRA